LPFKRFEIADDAHGADVEFTSQGASCFFDAVVFVKPDDFTGGLVEFGMVIDQVLENLLLAIELDAIAMYPFAEVAAVVEADDGFVERFLAAAVDIANEATAPVAVRGDPLLEVEIVSHQAFGGTSFEKRKFAEKVKEGHGGFSLGQVLLANSKTSLRSVGDDSNRLISQKKAGFASPLDLWR
jgi:hypothetical protein